MKPIFCLYFDIGIEKRNQYVLELLDQGLTVEEIRQRLMQKN